MDEKGFLAEHLSLIYIYLYTRIINGSSHSKYTLVMYCQALLYPASTASSIVNVFYLQNGAVETYLSGTLRMCIVGENVSRNDDKYIS